MSQETGSGDQGWEELGESRRGSSSDTGRVGRTCECSDKLRAAREGTYSVGEKGEFEVGLVEFAEARKERAWPSDCWSISLLVDVSCGS